MPEYTQEGETTMSQPAWKEHVFLTAEELDDYASWDELYGVDKDRLIAEIRAYAALVAGYHALMDSATATLREHAERAAESRALIVETARQMELVNGLLAEKGVTDVTAH